MCDFTSTDAPTSRWYHARAAVTLKLVAIATSAFEPEQRFAAGYGNIARCFASARGSRSAAHPARSNLRPAPANPSMSTDTFPVLTPPRPSADRPAPTFRERLRLRLA